MNAPKLKDIGFEKYNFSYEMYALTRLIGYILTGKCNFSKIKNVEILVFLNKGTSENLKERYQNINELNKE